MWGLIILVLLVVFFGGMAARERAARARFLAEHRDVDYSSTVSETVKALLREGHQIRALRQFRKETGLGLRDAKEFLSKVDIDGCA